MGCENNLTDAYVAKARFATPFRQLASYTRDKDNKRRGAGGKPCPGDLS